VSLPFFSTGSANMPPAQGGSTSENVDRATVTTRCRRCYRRSTERISPANAEFVCEILG